ncbi:MAG: YegS/Rv2252/BmrU family lipid kinase [Saprospiraceae bacterium]|nr:YegS/Rv2252/BmrU family lipid kinase [Saprospiraceae bacterium]
MKNVPKHFVFIINPNSGSQRLRDWEKLISRFFEPQSFEILYTRYAGHSHSILANYEKRPDLCVVAVGGDGTVSELIPALMHIGCAMGIVPTGSGNGLARHLKIPMQASKALQKLARGDIHSLDVLNVNDKYCCNTCGVGFSAMVTRYFGRDGNRGFWNYFKLAFTLHQQSSTFSVNINGESFQDVWALEIANSSQLGNNAVISPLASVNDGIMDILILKKPKMWQAPYMIFMVFSKNILNSKLSQYRRAEALEVQFEEELYYHIDGDYQGQCSQLQVKMIPSAIQIIA